MKLALCLLCTLPLAAQEPVRYELRFPNAAHHEAEIKATFSGVRSPTLEVVMSRSSPGRYALHEFAKNVYNFRATDGQGHPLTTRPTPYQWDVTGHHGTVVVEYTLFGDRADGTYSGIDPTHAHLNLPATLVWAHGFEKVPVNLDFVIPEGSGWKIATQLQPGEDDHYTAPFMDRMMDSPVELSKHYVATWKTGDSQFRMALHHKGTDEEAAAFAQMAAAVTAEEEGVWGRFPQYDGGHYTFLIDYLPYVNGDGMEHRDSTVIAGTRDLKTAFAQEIGTVSHEFFHSWNVGVDLTGPTLRDRPVYNAGLDRGDRITEWDGKSITSQRDLDSFLQKHKTGDKIKVKVEARGGKRDAEVTLAEIPALQMTPYELAGRELTPEMTKFREAWLSSKAIHPLPKLVRYCPVCKRSLKFEYENCPYDGAALRLTPVKPGEESDETAAPPAAGRGGGGRGGR